MYTDKILQVYWDGHDIEDLINRVGMIIPPQISEREKYFIDNVKEYENVLRRDPTKLRRPTRMNMITRAIRNMDNLLKQLSYFTDHELFGIFGYYVVYDSRKNLIQNLLSGLYGNTYFIRFDEIGSKLIVRRGSSNKIIDESDMMDKHISILRSLKELIDIYKNLPGADELSKQVEKSINNKIKKQIKLWPASESWLKK